MKLLLDTHVLVWMASDRKRLTLGERSAIEEHVDDLVVSTVSLWELRLKWRSNPSKARDEGLITASQALRFAEIHSIALAPLLPSDVVDEPDVPLPHKDPFDEMLVVHAQRLGARLLTRDEDLIDHPIAYSV